MTEADKDSYHAAMLFVKQLEAEVNSCDLTDWIRTELKPIPKQPDKQKEEGISHYDSFLIFKMERELKLKQSA